MSASRVILASLPSFCQKIPKLVEIWRSSDKKKFAQFFLRHGVDWGPMPNVLAALPNIGGAVSPTPQVWLTPTTRVPCSNAANMRYPLKFAGVPQTGAPISAASGPKFTILWVRVEEMLLFNKFFRLSIFALVAKIQPDKVVRWCPDGKFLVIFCVLYFQQAACSTFQTCILIRTKATPCVEVW